MSPATAVAIILELAVLLRLASGWWRHYPLFGFTIAAGLSQHLFGFLALPAYRVWWPITTPVLMLAQAAVMLELFRAWSGLWQRRRDWRILYGALLAAACILAWWSAPSLPTSPVSLVIELQRSLSWLLAATASLFGIFIAIPARDRAPAHLRIHTGIVVLGFVWTAMSYTAAWWWPEHRATVNTAHSTGWALLLAAWAARMPKPTA